MHEKVLCEIYAISGCRINELPIVTRCINVNLHGKSRTDEKCFVIVCLVYLWILITFHMDTMTVLNVGLIIWQHARLWRNAGEIRGSYYYEILCYNKWWDGRIHNGYYVSYKNTAVHNWHFSSLSIWTFSRHPVDDDACPPSPPPPQAVWRLPLGGMILDTGRRNTFQRCSHRLNVGQNQIWYAMKRAWTSECLWTVHVTYPSSFLN